MLEESSSDSKDTRSSVTTYIDKTKTLNYLHLVTPIVTASNNQELDSATKVIEEFVNRKLSEEKPLFRKKKDSNISVSSVTDAASEGDLEKKGVSQRVMNIANSLHSTSVADAATFSDT
jgi:hypothetical protein